ncbi:MAG: hypothetical protein LUI14_14600 [Lachnospiraceae bacterium]|nr:hypothetical protein [Lachnospiraceae bacterium]
MSVLASRRSVSRFTVINDATDLYNMLTDLAQRSFGVKDYRKMARNLSENCGTEEENIAKFCVFMNSATIRIEQYSSELMDNLRAAYTIWPTTMKEYNLRREYQDKAIIDCEQLMGVLQRVATKLNVDLNEYERYVKAIDREIGKIKDWRQRDNSIKSRLSNKGNV